MSDPLAVSQRPGLRRLQEAIDRLPAIERTAFLLAARDKLSIDEVCRRMSISSGRAERLIATALARLDDDLSRADRN
jgi:DNA-directed RNA polymerase specialized sigma24 family protein